MSTYRITYRDGSSESVGAHAADFCNDLLVFYELKKRAIGVYPPNSDYSVYAEDLSILTTREAAAITAVESV